MIKYVAYNIIWKGAVTTNTHLGHAFKKLHILMEQIMNRKLQELELTNAQGHAICFLTHAKTAPCARDMESTFGLGHATVSGILSRMESKGFIEVSPDPADRRVKRLRLLERGRASSVSIARYVEETEQIMSAGFTEEELEQFRSYLSRAISNLEQSVRETNSNREE